jgi:hypothetical protein
MSNFFSLRSSRGQHADNLCRLNRSPNVISAGHPASGNSAGYSWTPEAGYGSVMTRNE